MFRLWSWNVNFIQNFIFFSQIAIKKKKKIFLIYMTPILFRIYTF